MADPKPTADQHTTSHLPTPSRWAWFTTAFAALVIGLWAFPRLWYTQSEAGQRFVWLAEQPTVPGWEYRTIQVAESAERLLAADQTLAGEFENRAEHTTVRVFSAKRYSEKPHDIGLFVHTPDRCWTEGGWRLEPASPDHVDLTIHGTRITFERRVFAHGSRRELVLFGGLVGGRPLPYRLDHNLSVGMRSALQQAVKRTGGALRASDKLFWQRVWESFVSRRELFGPKQFIRISTELPGTDTAPADRLLADMLERWLQPADFAAELRAWKSRKT